MCYDDVAPLYEARGYHPLPVDPKDKFPVYLKADGTYGKAAGWTTEKVPLRSQGKANIGIRTGTDIGVVGVDVDTDDPDIQAALPAIVRNSLVKKRGQRGYTSFLYGPGTKSRKFLIDGKVVVEILGVGRQTVIPPSVHPVTQKPYEWVGDGFELLDVEPERDLAHVPADFERLIEEALRPFGYKEEAPKPEPSTAKSDDDQTPHRQLNDFARANLQRWVPELGLERWRRKNGRYLAYEAVATWRPSTQGRSTEQRAYNLSITSKSGITDFGDGRSYTPLDLVMAARTLNLSDAFVWLDDKLGWSTGGPEIVIPGPWEGSDKNARPEERQEAEEPPGDGQRRKPRPPAGTGEPWHFGTPAPALPPMLVPGLLPRKGYGYIGGQWGTLKTFITNDLAVAVATGGRFAGQQVTLRGVVVQIELEGSHSELRLQAAADSRGVGKGELPIVHLRSAPQTIMNNGKPNPEWPKWSKDLVRYAKEIAEFYELPLALITLDPQNRLAGFKDEQSSSEGQIVSNALNALWKQADCLVLVVDHFGKDAAAGLRGTSAKETNPLFVLGTGETKKDVHAERALEVRKMRNGPSGLAVPFWAEQREVTIKQEMVDDDGVVTIADLTEKTLTIRWGDEMQPVEARRDDGVGDPVRGQQRRALMVLSEIINGRGGTVPPPECDAPAGFKVARLDTWRLRLIDKTVLEGKNTGAAFSQLKNALLDKGEIDISAGYVWPKLG
jgi:AAA domain/Bifunctional DNA primase/polymerase, N-terminal